MNPRFARILKYCLLSVALDVFACSPATAPTTPEAATTTTAPDPELKSLLTDFVRNPDESQYQRLVNLGRLSSKPPLQIVADYELLSKKMKPVDDPTVNLPALQARFKSRSAADFWILEQIMVFHSNFWRRWTIAKCLGEYAGTPSLPALESRLRDPDEYVRRTAQEAIDNIQRRERKP